jgi:hypothetical protein
MRKTILALGLTTAMFALPALAQNNAATGNVAPKSGAAAAATNYECTDVSMKELRAEGDKMPDAGKKAMFMKEYQMAGDSMTGNDKEGCANHMRNLTNMLSQ